ncbi:uncharacterized protein TRIVIDRAFT_28724 [Trichoderma virens Gv29-8]|uniref:Zn(2)-C6 fungal-type domain-containing protein n=1 Tax=Hypocrea virens (strain Gv29-8 / FGSC 10586) TaxID=413071 RepID=G9MSL1_HYPVG|nr:uncharacterized protein TRIVIDRAFT_28724 [Trichoderma virens Gv29-8]EHK23014.1 hypothetical protein TRIVIDRAFT_28724 [Trichoderma virens Gv29-8]UKZ48074.1 hypothetical protein TrVGV298_002310 [Trichoderma virens]
MPPRQSDTTKRQQDGVKSPLSCHRCRRLKKRCDRQYPYCTLCHLRGVACDYPHHRKERVRRGDRDTPDEVSPSTSHQSSRTVATDKSLHKLPSRLGQENAHHQLSELDELDFLAASFLDPDHFILAQLETQKKDVGITKSVADLVGSVSDIQATAQVFFETIHVWMPIVSKKQFQDYLLQRLAFRRAEFFLLVLAMKLCSSRVTVAKSMLYRTVKQLYFDIESSGRLSIQTLQASVLIAIYEIGHGIYPAAIISVANCARIGTIIGIDRSLNTWDFISRGPWIELEERRRVWWAIIILDRFMNLCYPKRYLVTADPDPESYLPVDDGDWDSGFSKPEDAVTLRLSSQVHIGRFARFAHAVPLFSQALSRAHEDPQNTAQLRRTILSLISLGETEGLTNRVLFCTLNAVSYIAVFVLDNASSRSGTQDHAQPIEDFISPETISALEHALKVMAQEYFESIAQDCDTLSPFLLHMLYRALMAYLRMKHDPAAGPHIVLNIQALKLALERFRSRWLVAGTYLLLAKRQEVFSLIQTP